MNKNHGYILFPILFLSLLLMYTVENVWQGLLAYQAIIETLSLPQKASLTLGINFDKLDSSQKDHVVETNHGVN